MGFLSEAWKLLKRSWWWIVKFELLVIFIRLLVYVLEVGLGLALAFLFRGHAWWQGFVVLYTLVGLLGVLPAEKYLWYYVISSDDHAEERRLWRPYLQSFRYWARMIMGGFWWGVFASPLLVAGAFLFLPGLPGGFDHLQEHLVSFAWRALPLTPLFGALAVYGGFAVLGIVREGRPALASWRRAFSLIPRRDILATVGLLSVLYFSAVLLGLLLKRIPWFPDGLGELLTLAMLGGLSICHVTLWHAYTRAEGGAEVAGSS